MTKEDEELLRSVREWVPPKALHPIAMQAFTIFQNDGMKLTDDGLLKIKALLDAYGTGPQDLVKLAEAFEGLTRFTILLDQYLNEDSASKRVIELMKSYAHLYEPFWNRVGEALQNVSAEQRAAFQQFAGIDDDSKTAAAVNQQPPPGTIPLMALLPPARPPPWARKNEKK